MTDELVPASPRQLAPALWQHAYYGMTVDEVQHAFPAVIRPNEREILHDGAVAELILPDFPLAGHAYDVIFYFMRGDLSQVTLAFGETATIADAEALLPLLRAKYGPEMSYSPADGSQLLPALSADWMTGSGVNVALVCYENVCLNVVYQVRLAIEASKL